MKITWDEYFLKIAETVSIRSPDPKHKVGAVIVSDDNRILGTGYNGFVSGFNDTSVDWDKRDLVRPHIIHAEMNAILYSKTNLSNTRLYVTMSPCMECIKLIAAAGIKKIIFQEPYKDLINVRKFCIDNSIYISQVSK